MEGQQDVLLSIGHDLATLGLASKMCHTAKVEGDGQFSALVDEREKDIFVIIDTALWEAEAAVAQADLSRQRLADDL